MNISILLNKLFTVNSLDKIISGQNLVTYKNTLHELINDSKELSNVQAFNRIYTYMSKNHRNEYFYKNTLLNKILLGRHSIHTSTAIRELPVNGNILDFLIINGIGQVYEIKTEFDNLQRLKDQIDAYYTAFSYCNVVTDVSHLDEVRNFIHQSEVGIIVLTKRNTLHEERKAVQFDGNLSYKSMFKILRKYEFQNILEQHFGYLPDANAFEYYDACFRMFKEIDIKQAQHAMMMQLKKRSKINNREAQYFDKVPSELKSLVYFSNYNKSDFELLNDFLDKRAGDV